MNRLRRPWRLWRLVRLDGIAGQIRALLVVAIVAGTSIAATTAVLVLSEQDQPKAAATVPVRVATLVAALENLPRPLRAEVVASMRDDAVRLSLDRPPPSRIDHAPGTDILRDLVPRSLPTGTLLVSIAEERPGIAAIVVRLGDGQLVTIETPFSTIALLPLPLLLWPLVLLVVSVKLLSVWAARQIVAPLSRFAAAADQFIGDAGAAPLDERGPAEIRRASHAFNRMRERIGRLIEDRTNLLLAISHDLRTPLTRLRLRLVDVSATDEARTRALDDIATMESSITAAVTYLREGSAEEATERVELASMLTTICDQFADAGHPVDYVGPPRLAATCRPRAIDRAVTNLVDNATKYAKHVRLVLSQEEHCVCIEVQDDGPGIPDGEKQHVVKPFYRSDPARQQVRGFGLGLAIVSSIVQAEGGKLALLDNAPHGLRARITLPVT
jgi:signal transduction histidine kinase